MTRVPPGFQLAGVHCGIKQSSDREDVVLITSNTPCVAAGVYTQNQVVAAPVLLCRQRTPNVGTRAVITNSGNANACTGQTGMLNAERMLSDTAAAIGCKPEQVLVMSTGIIGEQLPMEAVSQGIANAAKGLNSDESALHSAARGFLTTDTREKLSFHTVPGTNVELLGIAKGSGMIGPNMATMLGVVLTNACLEPAAAQAMLSTVARRSFNSVCVDGHTSTNDTVLLLANGQTAPLAGAQLGVFAEQLQLVCDELARQIVDDGEGASHLIEIQVSGAEHEDAAREIAATIANSPLVKTAFAGNDPNWGRIVSAAGYSGQQLDLERTTLKVNNTTLFQDGAPVEFDAEAVSRQMQSARDILVELCVGSGKGAARFWTCDLTHEYIRINADYHT